MLSTQGLLDKAYVKVAFDAVKRRDEVLTFNARYEATDERIDTLALIPPIPISLDRTRVVRGGVEGLTRWREAGMTFTYGANFSRGMDALGARTIDRANALLPLSRLGADAVFLKFDGRFEAHQSLPMDFFWSLAVSGQTPLNKPMLTSEQFDITGSRALSGFTSGALPGDRGWVARAEFGQTFAPVGRSSSSPTSSLRPANASSKIRPFSSSSVSARETTAPACGSTLPRKTCRKPTASSNGATATSTAMRASTASASLPASSCAIELHRDLRRASAGGRCVAAVPSVALPYRMA